MKFYFVILFLLQYVVLKAQSNPVDPFEIDLANYEILDSNTINASEYKYDKKNSKIAVLRAPNKINVAYFINDSNKWFSVNLKENQFAIDYKLVNFDGVDLPEVVFYWQEFNYGLGGGTSVDCISVVKLDSLPIQVFKMIMGCNDESFGNKEKNGEGAYYNTYIRGVKVTRDALIISENEPKKYPFEECPISRIPGGTYKMKMGQFVKVQ